MKSTLKMPRNWSLQRLGFTLVEMLVAITLVMLMMLMFAQIFQLATESIGKMRGLSENDQRARNLQNLIKSDLDKRTYRWVYPFAAGESTGALSSKIGSRRGFFYISENNPTHGLDDVLHFTTQSSLTIRNSDTTPYYGAAMNLSSSPPTPNFTFPNQPDADDSQLVPNNTGESNAAEIVYFVRSGNLYRRQLLLRRPLGESGIIPQPADNNGRQIFNPTSGAAVTYPSSFLSTATSFWGDFDFSAFLTVDNAGNSTGAQFNVTDSLDNTTLTAIARPERRFGFSPNLQGKVIAGVPFVAGLPKEFTNSNSNTDDLSAFVGRLTLQECSDTDCKYPQDFSAGADVPTNPNLVLGLGGVNRSITSPDNLVDGIRRGEDLVLSNVHSFDIQVWDESIGDFLNLGDSTRPTSDYAPSKRLNTKFGPRIFGPANLETPTALNAVYDTWHPFIDNDGVAGNDNPPFLPQIHRTSEPVVSPPVTGFRGGWNNSPPPTGTYSVGDFVFPNVPPIGEPFFYRCVRAGATGTAAPGATEPKWPLVDGITVLDGPDVVWQAVENRKPLKAIKIEIRFLDVASQQMRQLTIVHSLVD